jgi:hypothetical protein
MTPKTSFASHREYIQRQSFCWAPCLIFNYIYYRHDFNHELAGEAFSDVRPDWQTEGIMDEWAKYAQSQMGERRIISIPIVISKFSL